MKTRFAPMSPGTLAFFLLAVCQASLALAQVPATTLDGVLKRVRLGDTVFVTDQSGREIKGTLLDVSDARVLIAGADDVQRSLGADSVRAVRWRRPDTLADGALIGLGVGAGGALIALGKYCANEGGCSGGSYVLFGLLYGGIGAGIGVGIDALVPGKKVTVYETPGRSARLTVAPLVTRTEKGIALRVGF